MIQLTKGQKLLSEIFSKKINELDNSLKDYKLKNDIVGHINLRYTPTLDFPNYPLQNKWGINYPSDTPNEIAKLYQSVFAESLLELSKSS